MRKHIFWHFFEKFLVLAGGAKPPQIPPLNGRSSHLIEAAKRGRLDQMIYFSGAADDTRDARTSRPAERPAGRPLTTRIYLRTETIDKRNIAILCTNKIFCNKQSNEQNILNNIFGNETKMKKIFCKTNDATMNNFLVNEAKTNKIFCKRSKNEPNQL